MYSTHPSDRISSVTLKCFFLQIKDGGDFEFPVDLISEPEQGWGGMVTTEDRELLDWADLKERNQAWYFRDGCRFIDPCLEGIFGSLNPKPAIVRVRDTGVIQVTPQVTPPENLGEFFTPVDAATFWKNGLNPGECYFQG